MILSNPDLIYHTSLLGSGYQSLSFVEDLMYSGLQKVVDSVDVTVEHDLLIAYYINFNSVNVNATSNILRTATLALEKHITTESGQSFNDYLFTNSVKVNQDFASLSSGFGVIIQTKNIL